MKKSQLLKQTVKSIKNQIVNEDHSKAKFIRAFYSYYIGKALGVKEIFKFPAAKFRFQNIILHTRPNTIDFWACLETYEPDLTTFFVKVLDKKGTFIDVGAHIGRFSTLLGKMGWKVMSFEPVKTNFKALEYNLRSNNCIENTQTFNIGLGEKNENITIFFDSKKMGEASIHKAKEANEQEVIQIKRFEDVVDFTTINDDLCVLKIDVEGSETNVINGMKNFLEEKKPLIILELWKDNSQNVEEYLKSIGYKRLHIFWYIEEKHVIYIEEMRKIYQRAKMNVEV